MSSALTLPVPIGALKPFIMYNAQPCYIENLNLSRAHFEGIHLAV